MPSVLVSAIEDADENQNGTSYNSTRNYIYLLQHTSTSNAKTVAIRFQVPDTISPTDVTGGVVDFVRVSSGNLGTTIAVESNAATLATNLTTRHGAAVTENGSVSWIVPTGTNGATFSSADFGAVLSSALTNTTPSGGYRTVAVIIKANIGSPLGSQVASIEHTTYTEPQLLVTYTAPPNFTATITTPINITVAGMSELVYCLDSVNYHSSLYADLYRPIGTTPSSKGWPIAVWVHGGRFVAGSKNMHNTNENYLYPGWLYGLLDNGIGVLSIDYRLSNETALEIDANHSSHPIAIKDVKTAVKYIQTRASLDSGGDGTYNINAKGMAIAAHSAGTQIALLAALSVGDATVYAPGRENDATNGTWGDGRNAYQSTSWGGGYPETYTFTYAPWGGTPGVSPHTAANTNTDIQPFVGIYLYAPLWDLYGAQVVNEADKWAVRAYMGRAVYVGVPTISSVTYNREGDPSDYCSPTNTDSIHYDGRGGATKRLPTALGPNGKHLPIGIAWSDDDTIIPPTYGATAMNNFYTTEGLTVGSIKSMSTQKQAVLTPADVEKEGLTRVKLPTGTGHDRVTFHSSPDDYVTWMKTVMAGTFYVMETGGIKRINPIGIMEGSPTASMVAIEYPDDIEFHSKHSNP